MIAARRAVALFATTAAVGALVACAPPTTPAPTALTFAWWGNDDRALVTERAIELFEERHPDITVDTTFATFDAYTTRLATQVATGSTPDVFLLPIDVLSDYLEKGAALDLTPFVGEQLSTSEISRDLVGIAELDGALHGLTLGTAASGIVYDPRVWADAGVVPPGDDWEWRDLIPAGEAIRRATGGEVAALSDPGGSAIWFSAWLRQQDKILFDDAGVIGFDVDDLAGWWELMGELREAGATTDAAATATIDQSMQNSGLARGLSAAELTTFSLASAYVSVLGETGVGLAAMPSDTSVSGMSLGPTNIAAVSARTSHPEASAMLLDFLVNDRDAAQILGLTRGLPPNTRNLQAVMPSLSGGDALVAEFVDEHREQFGRPDPSPPSGAAALPAEFRRTYESIIFGQRAIDDAAADLYARYAAAG